MHKIKNGMEDKIKDILASNKFNDLYDNFIELQKDCDVSFNIFTMISDKYHLENMHTDIIKCFLDPKEGHNEGYKFLFLFIDMINAIGKEGININKDLYVNAKVESQYPVDCNGEKGFIDIFISGDKHCIIFENKINNASDTYNQLPKYYGFCSKKYTVDAIVYLPLNDYKILDKGTWDNNLAKETEEKLIVLSAFKYNKINFIDNWIIPCSIKTNNIHCISILKQYSNLVKSLKEETMGESLLSLLLEKNIDISTFMNMTKELPKAMLKYLYNKFKESNLKDIRIDNTCISIAYTINNELKIHTDVIVNEYTQYNYRLRCLLCYDDKYETKYKNQINKFRDKNFNNIVPGLEYCKNEDKFIKDYSWSKNKIDDIINDIMKLDKNMDDIVKYLDVNGNGNMIQL